jgi:glycosyltransferase involved in cell wall biosynthesis
MRVLVNALSATNLSGRHVLLGHLSMISAWTCGSHEYVVLYHSGNRDICRDLGPNVRWMECPSYTSKWLPRSLWESLLLPRLISQLKIDFMFMPSGITVRNCPVPQVVFAQNPWSLVNDLERSGLGKVKASLQKKIYRKAMSEAAMMIFNSEYMRNAYRENAGFTEKASKIVYQGIDEATFEAAERIRNSVKKDAYSILSVSVMASHKGVLTLVRAVGRLVSYFGLPVRLFLVGPWPDRRYKEEVSDLIRLLRLNDKVVMAGYVSKERLRQYYAEARVFSLMSRCESFGIPAVEAQAFGTPVVSSNCCAIPEVCGAGGVYPDHDDIELLSSVLHTLLTDADEWERYSGAAVANASRFRWSVCSRPLLSMFDVVSNGRT